MSRWRSWTPPSCASGGGGAAPDSDNIPAWAAAEIERTGARFLSIGGDRVAGVWSDLDSLRLRDALEAAGGAGVRVVYLDGPEVQPRFKGRAVAGDPVPLETLRAMMSAELPWEVRDRMNRR